MAHRAISVTALLILCLSARTSGEISDALTQDNSVYAQAIDMTGLKKVLNDPSKSFTLFAPTDAAFQKLADNLGVSINNLYNEPNLGAILLYNMVPGQTLSSADLQDGMKLQTGLQSHQLQVDLSQPGIAKLASHNATATITKADQKYGNSIVHSVDVVLLPPDVYDMAQARESFGF
eukprot:jgi/Botrbrau1/6124/Bobra.331_2s0019.1